MKIGIIGSGQVGGTLGTLWAKKGHNVLFSSRNPEKLQSLVQAAGSHALAGTPGEAVQASDVLVLATPWHGTKEAVEALGDLSGKILIDCTNPLTMGPDGLVLAVGYTTSGGEEVAKWAKGARVVKAFNTIGFNGYENPQFGTLQADAYIAGDDSEAKAIVTTLAQDLGFDVIDVGDLSIARLTEPLALLWIRQALLRGMGREIAFKLLKR